MPVFFTSSNHPFPCQWSLREDASGKQQRLTPSCSLPAQDPEEGCPVHPRSGCRAQDAPEAGQAPPCSAGAWCHPCCSQRSQQQVPGHCHHGYLHILGTSLTRSRRAHSSAGLLEGGCSGANLPQKPVPSGRLALAAAPGAGERLAQFAQQTRRGGWLQPVKKLRRDRKRTA